MRTQVWASPVSAYGRWSVFMPHWRFGASRAFGASGEPVLNKTDLAAPLGVSVPTIAQWLGVLETTAQILIVPPFYENLGKRLIKSPKIYVADAGLACHLLGIDTAGELARSPFLGALFKGFIAAEMAKAPVNAGGLRELYYFRDEQGLAETKTRKGCRHEDVPHSGWLKNSAVKKQRQGQPPLPLSRTSIRAEKAYCFSGEGRTLIARVSV